MLLKNVVTSVVWTLELVTPEHWCIYDVIGLTTPGPNCICQNQFVLSASALNVLLYHSRYRPQFPVYNDLLFNSQLSERSIVWTYWLTLSDSVSLQMESKRRSYVVQMVTWAHKTNFVLCNFFQLAISRTLVQFYLVHFWVVVIHLSS